MYCHSSNITLTLYVYTHTHTYTENTKMNKTYFTELIIYGNMAHETVTIQTGKRYILNFITVAIERNKT